MSVLADLQTLLEASRFETEYTRILADARTNLRALIKEVASSPTLKREAAVGSYQHPNGFQKLLLLRSKREAKLLLHSWSEASLDRAVAADHAHNHRWPFATLVLMGAYRFECFHAVPQATGDHHHYRYRSPGDESAFELELVGRANLAPALSFELGPGAACWSDSSTIHRVGFVRTPLHTLFVQGSPDRSETRVITPEPAQETGAVAISRFSPDEWQERACAVIEALSRSIDV